MKTQLLKTRNLIVAGALFIILGFIIVINILAVLDGVTKEALFLFNFLFGGLFLLATAGWVQDMRWDAEQEKKTPKEEHID